MDVEVLIPSQIIDYLCFVCYHISVRFKFSVLMLFPQDGCKYAFIVIAKNTNTAKIRVLLMRFFKEVATFCLCVCLCLRLCLSVHLGAEFRNLLPIMCTKIDRVCHCHVVASTLIGFMHIKTWKKFKSHSNEFFAHTNRVSKKIF